MPDVPPDPDFEARTRASFARQAMMMSLGAEMVEVQPGAATISIPFDERFTQQHGFMHGGIVATVLDSAVGYSAFSMMDANQQVLTAEYKVNFVAPARGDSLITRGRIIKPGRTLMVAAGDAFAVSDGVESLVATMVSTLVVVRDRPDVVEG